MSGVERILSPGELLDPRHEVVPFHGRARELAVLARWRDEGPPASLLLLHGPAGVGKTRLARHFADDTVRVVDDAELLPWHELFHLLREASGAARVLLVSRGTGWWWSALRQRAVDLDYLTADLPVTPCPAEHGMSFAVACHHFADALGRPRPTPPPPPPATLHDLHLAALAAVHGSTAGEPAELVRWLADLDPTPPVTGRLAEDVLAVTLLDERIEPERTPDALETLLRAAERWPHALHRAQRLFTAHPELAGVTSAAALTVLAGHPAAKAIARQVFNDPRFHCDVLPAVLTRTLLHDRARTAGKLELAELHGMLGARAALAALREEAVDAAHAEVALYRELAAEDPAEHRPSLADALGDLGLRLIAVGRVAEAAAVSAEAVALCRAVAEDDEECLPHLAAALDQLSLRHAALGRRDPALAAVEQATDLYEDLSSRNPALFRLDFAKTTHRLAARLFDVGRAEDAARAAYHAVQRWRQVADADPRYEAEFARTLVSVGSLLSSFGRAGESSAVVGEAIAVLRRLAAANPRDFEPELAAALGESGTVLRLLDRRDDAARAAAEAVAVCRRVARDGDPKAVGELAVALGGLTDALRGPERLALAEEAVDLLRPMGFRYAVDLSIAQCRLALLLLEAGREHEARRIVDAVLDRPLPHRLPPAQGGRLASALDQVADRTGAARPTARGAALWRDLLGRHRDAPAGYAVAVRRTGADARVRARAAVLMWHLTRTPDELAAEIRYAETLSHYARQCAEDRAELDRALVLAHKAVMVLRAAKATPDRFARAVEAVELVVRAHPDPQVARARTQAMVARDWPSSS